MTYVLAIVLFTGEVAHYEYSTAQTCETALMDYMDQLTPKAVKTIECTKNG